MIEPTQLPSTVDAVIDGVPMSLPVYGAPQTYAADSYAGYSAIPGENMGTATWTGYERGDFATIPVAAGAYPGAKMTVIGTNDRMYGHRTAYQELDGSYYADAFEEVMDRPAPGAFFIIPPIVLIVAVIMAFVAVVIIGLYVVNLLFYAVEKSTEFTNEPADPNDPDNPWRVVCKGNTCQYFNSDTGETKNGPTTGSPLTELLMPVVYIGIAGIAIYAGYKVISALPSKKRSVV